MTALLTEKMRSFMCWLSTALDRTICATDYKTTTLPHLCNAAYQQIP
jgi:hypothetical protein